jgi:hypothetical protein
MSRRPDPERIDHARHDATRNRLIGNGVAAETADAWIAAWHAQAAREGLDRGSGYWALGWEWIARQRAHRRRP